MPGIYPGRRRKYTWNIHGIYRPWLCIPRRGSRCTPLWFKFLPWNPMISIVSDHRIRKPSWWTVTATSHGIPWYQEFWNNKNFWQYQCPTSMISPIQVYLTRISFHLPRVPALAASLTSASELPRLAAAAQLERLPPPSLQLELQVLSGWQVEAPLP